MPSRRTDSDGFEARPSTRVRDVAEADNDTWQETLAVVEGADGKLVVRSFYQSKQTGRREWDEPPSGATHIRAATDEMRKMANLQLTEMQVVTGAIDNNNKVPASPNNNPKKKKGFSLNPFKKNKKDKNNDKERRKIQYKSGSQFAVKKHPGHGEDAQLQEAIAMSLAEARGEEYVPGAAAAGRSGIDDEDDDEIAMAKALSMSEAESKGISTTPIHSKPSATGSSEDVMLQQALEASRADSNNNHQKSGDLLGLEQNVGSMGIADGDKKVAAKNHPPSVASSTRKAPPVYDSAPLTPTQTYESKGSMGKTPLSPAQMFDPYSPLAPDQAKPKVQMPNEQQEEGGEKDGPGLQKMKPDPPEGRASSRLHFGRRQSTKRMQDKAGVV